MELKDKIRNAPEQSGCYLFKDKKGEIIYVGKAKVLRNRVKQYFMKTNQQEDKGLILAKLICDVEFVITRTERDALLTEYQLIKLHRPWFNVQHKIDRRNTYYLTLNRSGIYPALEVTEHPAKRRQDHLGTFKSEGRAREAVLVLNRVFKTPVCGQRFEIPKEQPCLHYRVNQCVGPCSQKISETEYERIIKEIIDFFMGKQSRVLRRLKREMQEYSEHLEFEKASILKRDIEELRQIGKRQHCSAAILPNKDTVLFLRAYREIGFSVFYISKGRVTGRCEFEGKIDEVRLRAFLAKQQEGEMDKDNVQLDCLQNVYADKLVVVLPVRADLEKIEKQIMRKAAEWI